MKLSSDYPMRNLDNPTASINPFPDGKISDYSNLKDDADDNSEIRTKMLSKDVNPGKRYMCFVDICTEGVQFCDRINKRCRYCSDFAKNCLTNLQDLNCTRYCMEKWTETQQNACNSNKENGGFSLNAIILVTTVVIIVVMCAIYIIDNECLGGRIRQYIVGILYCCKKNKQPAITPIITNNQYRPVSPIEDDRGEGEGGEGDDIQPRGAGAALRDVGQNLGGSRGSDSSNNPNVKVKVLASVYQNNARNAQHLHGEEIDTEIHNLSDRQNDIDERTRHASGIEHSESSQVGGVATGELVFDSRRNGPPAISYQSRNINPQQDTGYDSGRRNFSETHLKTHPPIAQNQGDALKESRRSQPNGDQSSKTIKQNRSCIQNGTAVSEKSWQELSSFTKSDTSV